jgi:single-stranded DNA-binding protein
MIRKLDTDTWIAVGNATKDAELKYVGEKQSAMTTFSLACGKRPDTTTIFANCKAWRGVAELASGISKGDAVCCVGKIEEREYNGKTYSTLVCEWLNVAKPVISAGKESLGSFLTRAASAGVDVHVLDGELEESDDALPF